jgi:Mn2+/Fe2+ NRAMP family transporter
MSSTLFKRGFFARNWKKIVIFFSVFGPATITAMADNDATGVGTYSIAGAQLGYPILFLLLIITILLAVTQEMGMRLTVVTRRGLADLIREKFGVRTALIIFGALLIANLGTIVADIAAIEATAPMLGLPSAVTVIAVVIIAFILVSKGSYKITQNLMLVSCLFFIAYVISAVKAKPDWGMAISNVFYPHGVQMPPAYLKNYLLIGMGVLGTTVTPWGQFFISSFAYDKKIEKGKVNYSQLETYWGAFLTDFFSFFMIIATAATLFIHQIPLISGDQAALAIEPFAGRLAGSLFAVGMINAGFMGIVVISLSTSYAFAEFFGLSGSLDDSFRKSKVFYIFYAAQLVLTAGFVLLPGISFYKLLLTTQIIDAVVLPLIFFYLIKLTNDKKLMSNFANNTFQKYFAIICTVVIVIASVFALASYFIKG